MIILYPFRVDKDGHYYRFFSLEKMELRRKNLLELEYDSDLTKEQIAKIMEFMQQ